MRPNSTDGPRRGQINAKRFLLTYPRSDFDLSAYKDWATTLGAAKGIVSSEAHEDGALHRHALLFFDTALRSRDMSVFDFQGRHPNIISNIRSERGAIEYVQKDGDTVTWGNWENKQSWLDIVNSSDSQDAFLSSVKQNYPRDFVLQYEKIKLYAELHYSSSASGFSYVSRFSNYTVPDALQQWVTNNLGKRGERVKSLILVSPTRYGKTEWARSLGKHHYYNGMVNFKTWFNHPDLDYVIFDDFKWETVEPYHKQWFGCQQEFTVTDKYMPKKNIMLGVPLIWLCNDCPPLNDWMLGNVDVIYLNTPLF